MPSASCPGSSGRGSSAASWPSRARPRAPYWLRPDAVAVAAAVEADRGAERRRAGPRRGRGGRRVARLDRARPGARLDGRGARRRGRRARRRRRAGDGEGRGAGDGAGEAVGVGVAVASADGAGLRTSTGRVVGSAAPATPGVRASRARTRTSRQPWAGGVARCGGASASVVARREPAGASGPRPWPSRATGPRGRATGGYAVAMGLRCYLGHGASGERRQHDTVRRLGCRARGLIASAIDLPKRKAEDAVPAFHVVVPSAGGRRRRRPLVRRTGGQPRRGRARRAVRRRSSCSAIRSIRPASPSAPRPASPTGRPSAARSCCCPASPIRSPGSSCCAPPSRLLAERRAGHLPAARAHPQAGARRRARPRRPFPGALVAPLDLTGYPDHSPGAERPPSLGTSTVAVVGSPSPPPLVGRARPATKPTFDAPRRVVPVGRSGIASAIRPP